MRKLIILSAFIAMGTASTANAINLADLFHPHHCDRHHPHHCR